MTSTKIMLTEDGQAQLAHPAARRGYDGRNEIIEIVGTEDVSPQQVLDAYRRAILLPIMHAERPVPWSKLAGVRQGQIVRLES